MTVCDDMRTTTGANIAYITNIRIDLGLMVQRRNVSDIDTRLFNRLHRHTVTPRSEMYRYPVLIAHPYLYFCTMSLGGISYQN